jgi:hypothetical protein
LAPAAVRAKSSTSRAANPRPVSSTRAKDLDPSQLDPITWAIAVQISKGHARDKHESDLQTFFRVNSRIDFTKLIYNIMTNPQYVRFDLINGRKAYLFNNIVVIRNPHDRDGGTIIPFASDARASEYFVKKLN